MLSRRIALKQRGMIKFFFSQSVSYVLNVYSHVRDYTISVSLMQDIPRGRIKEGLSSIIPRILVSWAFSRTQVFFLATLKLVPTDGEHQSQVRALAIAGLVFHTVRNIPRRRSAQFFQSHFAFRWKFIIRDKW